MRTGLLMAGLTGLFLIIGYLTGGQAGMVVAFLLAAACNLLAYWHADRLVLSAYAARQVDRHSAPALVHLVESLSAQARLRPPRVYIADNDLPNAFATGRNPRHAAVCITSGLLTRVSEEELTGVLAHELGHVKNRDTLTMTLTAVITGAIFMPANFAFFFGSYGRSRNAPGPIAVLLMMLLTPIAALFARMAMSRAREFEADRFGAQLSGRPLWLASALENIDAAYANPAPAHLFVAPPPGGGIGDLFRSHPSTCERIDRLLAMAAQMGQSPKQRPRL